MSLQRNQRFYHGFSLISLAQEGVHAGLNTQTRRIWVKLDGGTMTGRSVLLVEDELLIRAILSDVLRDAGYQVTEASAGDEGVELLARQAFDILVTDVKMPGMVDGLQLAEYWKEQFPDRPVLAASAHVRAEDASAFDAIITKPFSDEELLRAVELLVNAQAPLPTAQLAS